MSVVTPFGNLDFDDLSGLDDWIGAHDQRHQTYRLAASSTGVYLQAVPLATMPDSDWFGRHLLAHLALIQFSQPSAGSYVTISLDVAKWNTAPMFYDWHNTHNLIHQRLDQSFGIQ